MNNDVRYVAVIDDAGLPIAGGMRGGINSIMDENNEELYLTHTALRKSMRERFDRSYGQIKVCLCRKRKDIDSDILHE